MKFIDTHCHLSFAAFKNDWKEVAAKASDKEVGVLAVGTNLKTSQKAVEIAEELGEDINENFWAAIGLHPIHLAKDITETDIIDGKEYSVVTKAEKFDKREFIDLARSEKVVAIGESGLDYFHLEDYKSSEMTADEFIELQKETLYEILSFAREVDKPHIFHCRDAYDDFAEIIKYFGNNDDGGSAVGGVKGVVHCFTGNRAEVEKMLDLGLYIGFTGIVTFPNAEDLQEVAKYVPLEKMLLETDSPYLAPQSVRGKRNDPTNIPEITQVIADLKGVSLDEVAEQTTDNARELFKLPVS